VLYICFREIFFTTVMSGIESMSVSIRTMFCFSSPWALALSQDVSIS
jgi:hypothetical protein